jgi:hypothetical protein
MIADDLHEIQHLERAAEFEPDDVVSVGRHRSVMAHLTSSVCRSQGAPRTEHSSSADRGGAAFAGTNGRAG